ncbi:MAG: citrate synthase [Acidobacteria bacterium]|nr:citrate synthase [Acidobacteriota bacterium]
MTTPTSSAKHEGLRDIVASPSSICFIDGDKGILVYAGYNIHDLAVNSTFEETVFLLWNTRLPRREELDRFDAELRANRELPSGVINLIRTFPTNIVPMDALRTGFSALAAYDPDRHDSSTEANHRKATRMTAQCATLVAAIDRVRNGNEPLPPRADLSHAANFLYMLTGKVPSEIEAKAFDIALILHADHEFNASTFAARVTAGTLADLYASITSAIGALSGPLHGGANEAVMRMLFEVGSVENVPAYVADKFAKGEKIMGIGHAVYRTEDPRATHLRRMSEEVGKVLGSTRWFDMSKRIEEIVIEEMNKRNKAIRANVDFYSASTYYMMGIAIDLFTPIFAVSRISGWTAHVLEQYDNNKLIRPRSEYVGPVDQTWAPFAQR